LHFTYILYSPSVDKYYIGQTSNIENRLLHHNKGSNKYTKRGLPWKLVYSKCFENKTEAIKFENYIKRMKSRKYIESLIEVG
jgi:putative endonuclease